MTCTKASACGRYIVIDDLHLDRTVFEFLVQWAAERQLRVQDAIQLAVCALSSPYWAAAVEAKDDWPRRPDELPTDRARETEE